MHINPDLAAERKKATIDILELTHFIDGGRGKTENRRKVYDYFLKSGLFEDKIPISFLSHEQHYEESLRKSIVLLQKIREFQAENNDISDMDVFSSVMGGLLGSAITQDGNPLALHYVMFIPALLGQASIEQQALWISRAWNMEIVGTYAQTELGHGTFLRGLETVAVYDKNTEEFELHSPTLTSYKWWPGGLGQTANYAIVMAQLHSNNQCHGIHPFIVQLRDEETHVPLPGIKIGEIGSKLGMNGTNNGFLGFDHVRIPRENMLMKNGKVLADGTYVKGLSEKLTYGTMIFVRCTLIKGVCLSYLVKAVTIAIRYSCVRKQGMIKPDGGENQIIDYLTQQNKLFPHLANVFALHFGAGWLWNVYNNVTSEMEGGDLERLPELHAMACCMKAIASADAARGIEECRRSCGGHGYMNSSGLPSAYRMATAAETYEGENTVLHLQTARFIIKTLNQALKGDKLPTTCVYMAKGLPKYMTKVWTNSMTNIVEAFNHVALGLATTSSERIQKLVDQGKSFEDAWNEVSNLLVSCSEAHCRAFMIRNFYESVVAAQVSRPLKDILMQLCELYGVYFLLKDLGFFLMYTNVKKSDVCGLQEWRDSLLMSIRPNAVALVDSFDIPDNILSSALGCFDGNVYEKLFEEANKSPLNQSPVHESFHKYLKPFLKSNM